MREPKYGERYKRRRELTKKEEKRAAELQARKKEVYERMMYSFGERRKALYKEYIETQEELESLIYVYPK